MPRAIPIPRESQLVKLQRAYEATSKLLWGDVARLACQAVVKSDLRALLLQLDSLSTALEFDCIELAEILTTSPTLSPNSTSDRINLAKESLLITKAQKSAPSGFDKLVGHVAPAGLAEIQRAADSGDIKFFIKLGDALRHEGKGAGDFVGANFDLKFTIASLWQPCERWPGLAYCKNPARMEWLEKLGHKLPSKRNFDQIWRRDMRLKTARKPFVSSVKVSRGKFTFS